MSLFSIRLERKAEALLRGDGTSVTIIRPSKGGISLNFKELVEYRELLYFLVWRDVKVRYKQTAIGASWAILQPVMLMVVLSVVFGWLAKLPTEGIPYPIFAFSALLPWQLFSGALTASGNSIVANQQLITRVYFPRLIIPLSAVLAGLLDFIIAFFILLGLMVFYGVSPSWATLSLPLFVLFALASALAVGIWLSALNVHYRDVRHIIPFLTQFWLFATPIAYSSSMIPEPWRVLYGLNPMAGVVEGFRWALLGRSGGMGPMMVVSALVVAGLLVGGLVYFRRMERTFADVI